MCFGHQSRTGGSTHALGSPRHQTGMAQFVLSAGLYLAGVQYSSISAFGSLNDVGTERL